MKRIIILLLLSSVFFLNFSHSSSLARAENSVEPFIVDDSGAKGYTWSELVSTFPWCTGSGTEQDPYVIDYIQVEANEGYHCVTINNTDAHFEIRDSNFYDSKNFALYIINSKNGHLHGLEFNLNTGTDIFVVGSRDIVIENCQLIALGRHGLVIQDSESVEFRDSSILGGDSYGIWITSYSSDIMIVGNVLLYANDSICLTNSFSNEILNNTIQDNGGYGMNIWDSDDNLIQHNSFNENGYGIVLARESSGNTIIDNYFYNNEGNIALFSGCEGNIIQNNNPNIVEFMEIHEDEGVGGEAEESEASNDNKDEGEENGADGMDKRSTGVSGGINFFLFLIISLFVGLFVAIPLLLYSRKKKFSSKNVVKSRKKSCVEPKNIVKSRKKSCVEPKNIVKSWKDEKIPGGISAYLMKLNGYSEDSFSGRFYLEDVIDLILYEDVTDISESISFFTFFKRDDHLIVRAKQKS